MRAITSAIGDAIMTCLWVFCASTFGLIASTLSTALGLQASQIANICIITSVIFVFLFIFGFIGAALGGASFNPSASAAFYAAGVGSDSLLTMAIRLPAQAAGAVAGVLSLKFLLPPEYTKELTGPRLKVDLHTGAIAEGVLTFSITFIVLVIILKGPKNSIVQSFLIAVATIVFVLAGAGYTGPSMNPANAFGWAYFHKKHDSLDHFYVYWICPFVGALLAASVFKVVFPRPKPKKKKQKKA